MKKHKLITLPIVSILLLSTLLTGCNSSNAVESNTASGSSTKGNQTTTLVKNINEVSSGVYDDFSSSSIDTNKWIEFDNVSDVKGISKVQNNGQLEITFAAVTILKILGVSMTGLKSTKVLPDGDFTITVDYNLITWPESAKNTAGTGVHISLTIDPYYASVERCSLASHYIDWEGVDREAFFASFSHPEYRDSASTDFIPAWGNTQGKLKWEKKGGVLTSYYCLDLEGSQWVKIGSKDVSGWVKRMPSTFSLSAWINSTKLVWKDQIIEKEVKIAFDNVVIESGNTEINLTGWDFLGHYDLSSNDLWLGNDWILHSTLKSGGKPLNSKTIRFEKLVNDTWVLIANQNTETQKVAYIDPPLNIVDGGCYIPGDSFKKPGIHKFRATFDGDSTYSKAVAYFNVNAVPRADLDVETDLHREYETSVSPVFMNWDQPFVISGRLYDSLKKPIVGASVSIRYSEDNGQSWQNLSNGESVTSLDGTYQVKMGGNQTPVFPKKGIYIIKAIFAGGDYNGVTFKYTESISIRVEAVNGLVWLDLKSFNNNPVSFETFKVTCTVKPIYSVPVTGPVVVILYANWNGAGEIQIAKYSGTDTVITFPVSLTSGNYVISAKFVESSYYYEGRTSVDIKVGT